MENKTGKYFKYAIGEIILVVIGILIALQINNWNEARKARINEKINLTQLLQDFNSNKAVIKKYLKNYDINKKYLDVTLRSTGPNVQLPTPEAFDSIVDFWNPSVQLLYTKPETIAGLNLNQISNINLKKHISTFPLAYANYEKVETIIEKLTIEQRKIHQNYMPLIADEPKYIQNIFVADSVGLLRDRQLQNVTVDKFWNVKSATSSLAYIEKHNDSIISLLKIELDKLSND